jgi:GT2 family glycosyltransferase
MQKHLISVIIVNWNTRKLLRGCINSLLDAELGSDCEIVVVDNNSSDGSAEMIEQEFPEVRLIANRDNRGFAVASNQGIHASCGRYVLLLNPDTKATKSFLRILLEVLENNSKAAAAGPLLVHQNGEIQLSCLLLPTLWRELLFMLHLKSLHKDFSKIRENLEPRKVETIGGACILIRREVLNQIGLLDEQFFLYSEEIDLCRRILESGREIYWAPMAKLIHYGGESSKQAERQTFIELFRSKVVYFRKHFGSWGSASYKFILLFTTLLRLAFIPAMIFFHPSSRRQFRALNRNYRALLMKLPDF